MAHLSKNSKRKIIFGISSTFLILSLFLFVVFFRFTPSYIFDYPMRFLWIIFAFISGFSMVGSSSLYPLATYISTIDNENKKSRSFVKLFVFSISTIILLSLFGIILPLISQNSFFERFDFNKISSLLYVVLGLLVYTVSLSKLNVLPLFDTVISKNFNGIIKNFGKTFSIAIFVFIAFFAEIMPSTWLLFMESGLNQNIKYGLVLFLFHAIGRIFLVSILQIISSFGIDSYSWFNKKRDSFKNLLNVSTITISSIIISIGLYSLLANSILWGNSIYNFISTGWLVAFFLVVPLWASFFIEESRVYGSCKKDMFKIKTKITELENESHHLLALNKDGSKAILNYIERLRKKIIELSLISKILESSLRHDVSISIKSNELRKKDEKKLHFKLIESIIITLILITAISMFSLN